MASEFQIRLAGRRQSHGERKLSGSTCASSNRQLALPVVGNNLAKRFLSSCQSHGSRLAVCDQNRSMTYRQIRNIAIDFANHLTQRTDFDVGDHLGLRLPNGPEYIAVFYGALIAGAIVVPMPFNEVQEKIDQLGELAELRFFVSADDIANSNQFESGMLVHLRDDDRKLDARISLGSGGNRLAMLMFTSGSTGLPKAVMLSHRNLIANCDSICDYLPIDSNDRALAVMPFCHAFGNSILQTHILNGACLVTGVQAGFAADIIHAIREYRCTSLSAVPEVMETLLDAGVEGDLSKQLKYLTVAGGAMHPQRAVRLRSMIDSGQLFVMYGQTEATARLTYVPPNDLQSAAESIGRPVQGVKLEVRSEAGKRLKANQPGMLYARGENIMSGYWRDTELTNSVLKDGWLCTGDIAVLRDDGFFQLCGRNNGLVKIQGHRFHPVEVEQRIMRAVPGVKATATDFEFYGKTRLALFVISESQNRSTESEIRMICREILPSHMVPQRFKILREWPMNSAGKIDRIALRKSLNSSGEVSFLQKRPRRPFDRVSGDQK